MVILAILALLLLASLVIAITNSVKPKIARSWTIALVSASLAWLAVFVLRLFLPSEFPLFSWQPETLFLYSPFLVIDYSSWPYAMALITLCMAVIFTDSTRSFMESSPATWAGSLAITAINLMALLAGDPMTLTFAWVLVDCIELIYLLRNQREGKFDQHLTTVFGVRLLSVFALIFATVVGWQVQPGFSLAEIPAKAGIFFLLAAGLRLGVLPLNLPFMSAPETKNGVNVLLRLSPVASSLALIARLPSNFLVEQQGWLVIITILTTVAAIYASAMWLTRKDEFSARPYWIVALAAFAIMCALNGQAGSSLAWGVALLLSGGVLFLFDPPIRRIRFLPILGLLGLIALPYTPAASGWEGLLGSTFTFSSVCMIFSHALLVLGYLRYAFESSGTITGLEKHARITYPLGLILILQTILVIGLVGWPGVLTLGKWYGSLVSTIIVGLGLIAYFKLGLRVPFTNLPEALPSYRFLRMLLRGFQYIFSLQWVYSLVARLSRLAARLGTTITTIVEGDGGILWSLVFLAVLITLFVSRVSAP
ncbi:MAG: hypothetical protein WA110_10365 [Anaerolineaceae bacterium]